MYNAEFFNHMPVGMWKDASRVTHAKAVRPGEAGAIGEYTRAPGAAGVVSRGMCLKHRMENTTHLSIPRHNSQLFGNPQV